MIPARVTDQAPIPPPSYHRALATALHLDALTVVIHLHLLTWCRVAVQIAHPEGSKIEPSFCQGRRCTRLCSI